MHLHKILNRSDFIKVYKKGSYSLSDSIILQYKKIEEEKEVEPSSMYCKVGITVSKKVGKATKRNKIKRRIRSLISKIFPENAKSGFFYVIVARKRANSVSFQKLNDDLFACMRKKDLVVQ